MEVEGFSNVKCVGKDVVPMSEVTLLVAESPSG